MKPGSDISNGAASSLTGRLPPASAARIARRVGSASAENTASSGAGFSLSMSLAMWAIILNHMV